MFTTREQRKNKEKSNFLSFIVKDPEYYNFEETVFNIFAFIVYPDSNIRPTQKH